MPRRKDSSAGAFTVQTHLLNDHRMKINKRESRDLMEALNLLYKDQMSMKLNTASVVNLIKKIRKGQERHGHITK